MWFLALVLCAISFVHTNYVHRGNDITIDRSGKDASLRETLTQLVTETVPNRDSMTKMGDDVKNLITGKAIEAARGVNFYMKVDANTFALPSYADGIEAIAREFAAHGTDEVIRESRECLEYVLHERAGSNTKEFSNGNLKRDCDAHGCVLDSRMTDEGLALRLRGADAPATAYGMRLADFVLHSFSVIAGLFPPEVLALRLYTTAAFRSLNTPLRDQSATRPPHPFPITINYIKSGIGKLRAVEASQGDKGTLDLWRGMKNLAATHAFKKDGGTELAPMSTTTDLAIAVKYAASPASLLLKIKTKSFMQRGADLTYLSAFPGEAELLYPPLTYLRPTGVDMAFEAQGTCFTVVEVEPFAA